MRFLRRKGILKYPVLAEKKQTPRDTETSMYVEFPPVSPIDGGTSTMDGC